MKILSSKIEFPNIENANEYGIVAVGGDLSTERLKLAYQRGVFPWFNEDEPILWWSPDPRFVLYPEKLRVSKSMRKVLRDEQFTITYNKNFEEVVRACQKIPRNDQGGTWITEEMIQAYVKLHNEGWAKSVEVWEAGILVGGLYGVEIGEVFCGESMFSKVSNASKAGFISFVQKNIEKYQLIDCQIHSNHLESLGAEEIPRKVFSAYLQK